MKEYECVEGDSFLKILDPFKLIVCSLFDFLSAKCLTFRLLQRQSIFLQRGTTFLQREHHFLQRQP